MAGKTGKDPVGLGRPTDYKPTYGEEIISLMATGLSLTAAAAELGFHRQRVYEWAERHPDFADAVNLARGKRTLKLERDLLSAPDGPTVTSRIFALKNAAPDEWREKQAVELSGTNGGPIEIKRVVWDVVDPSTDDSAGV